ncbi:MAG: NifB/NifX family molybdenum-iron cluster-binding protein [Candidatus Ventricola sp.]
MKIAVTYENGQIFQHFGHCATFKLYEAEDGQVLSSRVIDATGSGHSLLAGFLMMNGVDELICGGIGGGAQSALRQFGIKIHGGVQGDADEAVRRLLAGTLEASDAPNCSHHDEHHGADHVCGEHGCGGHEDGGACSCS